MDQMRIKVVQGEIAIITRAIARKFTALQQDMAIIPQAIKEDAYHFHELDRWTMGETAKLTTELSVLIARKQAMLQTLAIISGQED